MDLERFIRAQDRTVRQASPIPGVSVTEYERALVELRGGQKRSPWICFIFPQIFGYGKSINSRFYGIKDFREAESYLEDEILASRLRTTIQAVVESKEKNLTKLFGCSKEVSKFRACMTLFSRVSTGEKAEYFSTVLQVFFKGDFCEKTLQILLEWPTQ